MIEEGKVNKDEWCGEELKKRIVEERGDARDVKEPFTCLMY